MSMQVVFDFRGGKRRSRGAEDIGESNRGRGKEGIRGQRGEKRNNQKEKRGKWASSVSMMFEILVSRGVSSLEGKIILP